MPLSRIAWFTTVAICLPVLMAVVALSLDTGMIYDRQRHSQAAADAAALAAAADLFNTYTDGDYNNNGTDPHQVARDHARAIAAANGYPDDKVTAEVDVGTPVHRQFAGANADPTFAELMAPEDWPDGQPLPWDRYCTAFAAA